MGKVIKKGGVGVTIYSLSGWRMPALTAKEDEMLATMPTEELLYLPLLQSENIRDTLYAYQMAKRCNEKRGGFLCQLNKQQEEHSLANLRPSLHS